MKDLQISVSEIYDLAQDHAKKGNQDCKGTAAQSFMAGFHAANRDEYAEEYAKAYMEFVAQQSGFRFPTIYFEQFKESLKK